MSYQQLFEKLWEHYVKQNPHAQKVHDLFEKEGEVIVNDHVAFRTFNHQKINIEALAKFFKAYGYKEMQSYEFPVKKLFAKHYEHPDPNAPKVFISELLTEKLSPALQKTVDQCVADIPDGTVQSEDFLYSGRYWSPLDYKKYQALLAESEYAAWMYAFGFCANHFTVNVNAFKKLKEIKEVNELLMAHQFSLNSSGGLVKGTPNDYLEQSSTLAEEVEVVFSDGVHRVPSCYYEFAKRYMLPEGRLYTGFVAASADKIFESTNVKKD
jgi:hypothetical protein